MSNRNIRVSELLRREISEILHTRFKSEAVSITITGVDVSPDHSNAKVFYSFLTTGTDHNKAQRFLDRFAGKIRHELGKRIVLKRMPALKFMFDSRMEQGTRIMDIIESFDIEQSETED